MESQAVNELATPKQIDYLRDLGVCIPSGLTKEAASILIDDALEKQPITPRQQMVLNFWGYTPPANWKKIAVSSWMDEWYAEDPDRREAWELFKIENSEADELSDPNFVAIGIGKLYLERVKLQNANSPDKADHDYIAKIMTEFQEKEKQETNKALLGCGILIIAIIIIALIG